ncbi:MerR family transcriptional regulator [Streptomyces sp. NPDC091682]|uniref:MerR family transcriptional regulator n=1 Tax=unclassified Streptomyces TaxID=2593676 RepID=UPI003806994B
MRSWERRYAIGPAVRVAGKHRRWLPENIARLEEMCHLTGQGVPPAEAARAARVKAAGAFRFEDDAPATGEAGSWRTRDAATGAGPLSLTARCTPTPAATPPTTPAPQHCS